MAFTKRRFWRDWTTAELAATDLAGCTAVLPVSAIEQHGPHLPLSVDADINEAILARTLPQLDEDHPVLILPAQEIGRSAEHAAFAGTLSHSPETLRAAWTEVLESAAEAGVGKILIFNSHGGQPEVMDLVARDLRVRRHLFVAHTSWPHLVDIADLVDEPERSFGIHGGLVETAMMLAIRPEAVRGDKMADFTSRAAHWSKENRYLAPDGAASFGWMTQDLNASGAVGDPRGATAELGEEILSRAARALADLLVEVDRFAWPVGD